MAFTTWNPADKSSRITLSGGNLVAAADGTSNHQAVRDAVFKSAGKWYCELTVTVEGGLAAGIPRLGISTSAYDVTTSLGVGATEYCYIKNATKFNNGSNPAYGASWTTGDVISVLFDADAGTLTFWKNGADQGEAYSGISGEYAITFDDFGSSVITANFGASAFTYTPPGGYTGWTIPDPAVGDASFQAMTAAGGGPASCTGAFQAMTAEGGGPATGSALFALITASVTTPIVGAVSFQPMTAQAVPGVTGAASFQPMTAQVVPGRVASSGFEQMSASGDGSAGSVSDTQYTEFRALAGTGQGSAGSVAEGSGEFSALAGYARTTEFVDIAFEAMAAEAAGLTGGISSADVQFRPATAGVSHSGGSLSLGSAAFTASAASATSLQAGTSVGVASFRSFRLTILALVGGAGAGSASFEATLAEGQSGSPSISIGAASFERLSVRARAYPLLTDEFRTFVMNAAGNVLTEYQAYPFNSYAEVSGRFYGAGPSGIFTLDGATDAGVDIAWTIRTGMLDDKNAMLKRLDEVLLSARFDGPMRLRVWTDDSTYFDYNVVNYRADVVHQVRAKLGKGRRSRFYRVELFGINNTSAEISTMQLPMQPLKRRVG